MPQASNQMKMFRIQTRFRAGEQWHNLWSWCKSADELGVLRGNRNCWLSTFDGEVFESSLIINNQPKKMTTNLSHTKPRHVVSTQHTLIVSYKHCRSSDTSRRTCKCGDLFLAHCHEFLNTRPWRVTMTSSEALTDVWTDSIHLHSAFFCLVVTINNIMIFVALLSVVQ